MPGWEEASRDPTTLFYAAKWWMWEYACRCSCNQACVSATVALEKLPKTP